MQWEDDEEDELQARKGTRVYEEKRYDQGGSINVQQHRRKEVPVYEDAFTKRLGRRSTSTIRDRPLGRVNGSSNLTAKTGDPSKMTSFDENLKFCEYH